MTDIVLDKITSGYNLSKINKNFEKVEDVINDEVLHLEGGNNVMKQDLDMNGHALLNLGVNPDKGDSLVTLEVADARYYNVTGDKLEGTLDANGQPIVNLRAPVNANDPVRKTDVDGVVSAYQAADANLQAQLTGEVPLEASAFSEVSWHDQVIDNSVVIPPGKNAWSFGPQMTIAQGQSVTVSEGSTWTIADGDEYEGPIDQATYIKKTDLASSTGSSLVGYKLNTNTSVARTEYAKLSEVVSILDFGAIGDGSFDCTSSIQAALDYVRSVGGGRVLMPAGKYKVTGPLSLNPIVGVGWHNLILEGQGRGTTTLDFTSQLVGNPGGIKVNGWGGRVTLKGFSVLNTKGVGIELNPVERGSANYISRCVLEDLIVDGCTSDGFRFTQTYMCSGKDIEARNNGGYGFNLRGSHTSMTFNRCWAGGDAASPQGGNSAGGWTLNGLVYSSFESCSADNNAGPGWTIKATGGVTLTSCGSEANVGTGFLCVSDDNNISAIPTPGINGLILDGCFAVNNGSASSSTPNFLQFSSSGTRTGTMLIRGCYDIISGTVGSLVSTFLVGAGGAITLQEEGCFFQGTRLKSGTTYTHNLTSVGKSAVARLSADSAISNATNVVVPFGAFDNNRMGASLSSGGIVIPTGVNRVKISAGLFWNTNSTGSRVITFYKNGSSFYGTPSQKNAGIGFTGQATTSAIVEVVPGDVITVIAYQDSGSSLNVIANANTYLSVECLG